MSNLLDRINAAVDGLCPCGAPPADGSAYCSDDCRPTHISGDTDIREAGHLATPMRWRPDLVTEADDTGLLDLGTQSWYVGRFHAQIYEHIDQPGTWHLRLDDGHRFVGCDLDGVGGRQDPITDELIGRVRDAWRRLERELVNPRHTEPVSGDPWADVFAAVEAARAMRRGFASVGFLTDDGLGADSPNWDVSGGTSPDFRVDNTAARFDPLPSMLGVPVIIDDTMPTGDATLDRAGETLVLRARDRSFTLTEEVQEQIRDHYAECSRRAAAAMVAFDEVFRPVLQQFGEAITSAFAGASIAAQPVEPAQPDDPMERALQARRNRNTGPAPNRLDGRRRRR